MEQKFQEVAPEKRLQLLKDNCLKSESQFVKIDFTEDDLTEMKSRLSENSIEQFDLEEELKLISKDLRDKIKACKTDNKGLLKDLKNKFYEENQEVFMFDDQENGLMLTYSQEGLLISSRKLKQTERQSNILTLNTGTNGK